MKNLRIFAPLLSGDQLEFGDCPTGRDLIRGVFHDDWASPPKALVIEATDKDGRIVRIVIPNDNSEMARITITVES